MPLKIKDTIISFDFFATTEYFRHKSQSEYKSFFGGITSLILILGLSSLFTKKLIDTAQKTIITSDSENSFDPDPTLFNVSSSTQGKFMFGVNILQLNLNQGKRYFDIVMTHYQLDFGFENGGSKQYPLEPCRSDHWAALPQYEKYYDKLKMNQWLCLPTNLELGLQGKYVSERYQSIEVKVVKCKNQTDPSRPCASEAQIDDFFKLSSPFYFTVYFINPLINPTSEDYLTYYLEDVNYLIFTQNIGVQAILFLSEYQINTDESVWPFSSMKHESGSMIKAHSTRSPYEIYNEIYCSYTFVKSPDTWIYNRSFQKIDDIFSYIGGLFGTITIFLFFIKAYNESEFQIKLASLLIKLGDDVDQRLLEKYNFISFLILSFYNFLKGLNIHVDWKNYKDYDRTISEIYKQLDVSYLLKRLIFLEKAINTILDEHHLHGIHMQDRMTLEEAQKSRKQFKTKKKFEKMTMKKIQEERIVMMAGEPNPSSSVRESSILTPNRILISQYDKINEKKSEDFEVPLEDGIQSKLPQVRISNHDQTKKIPSGHQHSSSSQSQEGDSSENHLMNQFEKLKQEAEKGVGLSVKIYSKFLSNISKPTNQNDQKHTRSSVSLSQYQNNFLSNQKTESDSSILGKISRSHNREKLNSGSTLKEAQKPTKKTERVKIRRKFESITNQNP